MADLRVVPIGVREALRHIQRHHSHHDAPPGASFAAAVARGESVVCVALVGRPVARLLDEQPTVAEVTRCASDGTLHAASMCLAAARRMALAAGYRRLVSYTLIGEEGTSYRAAGWWITGLVAPSQRWHTRPGRTTRQPGGKVRWETGPDALPADGAAALVAGMCAGRVEIPLRRETLPLLAEMESER